MWAAIWGPMAVTTAQAWASPLLRKPRLSPGLWGHPRPTVLSVARPGQAALTCVSTNMAMSMNISCSSRMLVSSFRMSLWRDSISLSACLVMCESEMILERHKERAR